MSKLFDKYLEIHPKIVRIEDKLRVKHCDDWTLKDIIEGLVGLVYGIMYLHTKDKIISEEDAINLLDELAKFIDKLDEVIGYVEIPP